MRTEPLAQLFTRTPEVEDASIVRRIDFVGLARESLNWSRVAPEPPLVVDWRYQEGMEDWVRVTDALRDAAVASRALTLRPQLVRGMEYMGYEVNRLLSFEGETYELVGTQVHEGRNHELQPGRLRVKRLFPVSSARLSELAEQAANAGKWQNFLTLSYLAGNDWNAVLARVPIDGTARDAPDDIEWRVDRLGWQNVVVNAADPMDECPYLMTVTGTVEEGAKTDWGMCAQARHGAFTMTYVPRAGLRGLGFV